MIITRIRELRRDPRAERVSVPKYDLPKVTVEVRDNFII